MPKRAVTGLWRPLVCFVGGILLAHLVGRDFAWAGEVAAFFVLLFLVTFWYVKKRPLGRRRRWAGVTALAAITALSFWATFLKNTPKTLPVSQGAIMNYAVTLVEGVSVKPASVTTVGALYAVRDSAGKWSAASGKVALSFPRSFEADALRYGEQLLVYGSLEEPPPPNNPFQFNYRQFLQRKHIQWQEFLTPERFLLLGQQPPSSIRALSYKVRRKLEEAFRQYLPEKRELAIARALVLGVKDDVDVVLRNTYSRTGTMHVLAVSGLHVGTFYALLLFLFRQLRQRRGGRLLVGAFLISVLWFYAFLTGMAPSVLRSVTMFTIVEMGFILSRRASVMNSLAVAAFVLLLYEPNLLLDVGFQLSFAAVAGIVLLQPRLSKIWEPKNRWLGYVWQLFTLSVAAQLATSPLSLYYFHQFPVYFGVSNLFAVPLATFALYAGILFMVVSPVPALATLAVKPLFWILWLLNEGLRVVEQWPNAVLDGFVITPGQVLVLYLLIGALFLFIYQKHLSWLGIMALCVAFLSGTEIAEAKRQRQNQELVIYSSRRSSAASVINGSSAASVINGRSAFLVADSAFYAQPQQFVYTVQPHWWARGVEKEIRFGAIFLKTDLKQQVVYQELPSNNKLLVWRQKRILWLEKLPKDLKVPVQVEVLVLQHNVWAPVTHLQNTFKTNLIILDQTNSRRYTQQKAAELRAAGYRVHELETEGAWKLKLK
ncbi:ComEC/Rec2 family competence protein [Rufibacter roseus]|uniref:ComEC/Rec2 family competence protein n=1 Tax=Rufibacter roseus TaxID=1567108 RepID=A0ABW2DMZ9_9BACT|nr:ComEC/Rec2 family competence protein [Rufibacter roseus]